MDNWEKFDETTLPPKEPFYSNLNLEDNSDEDYTYAQKVWDVFLTKSLGEYHDLYVKSEKLLLADVYLYEICVLINMKLILHIMYLHLDWHGKLV